ncbi:MAG: AAA family ATPase [Pseudomonadota bacterium]
MKLCALRLGNVRRFVDPVEIREIGPGLNVLTAPNEQGKSTVFDALHAVFFEQHRSQKTSVKALQPHAGGAPQVTVEIEHDGARYRIAKTWKFGRGEATVHRGETLLHQADAAEAFLETVVQRPADGGPAGLLWVRQGGVTLDPKDDVTARARRALATSVATSISGEIEAMTGGRHLEAALAHCRAELDRYETARGGARKGGPLQRAEEAVAELTEAEAALGAKADALREAIDTRERLRRERARLLDPEEAALRQTRLLEAQEADAAARAYADRLARAEEALGAASGRLEGCRLRRDALLGSIEAHDAAREEAARSAVAAAKAVEEHRIAAEALEAARAAETDARMVLEQAADRHKRVLRAAGAAASAERRKALTARLAEAEAAAKARADALAEAAREISAKALETLEARARDLDLAERLRESAAPAIAFDPAPGGEGLVSMDGTPLSPGARMPIPDGARFDIAGVGRLTVFPGEGGARDGLDAARRAFSEALEAAGCTDLAAARASDETRRRAEMLATEAAGRLKHLAPEGVAALRQALAALPEPMEREPEEHGAAEHGAAVQGNGADLPSLAEGEAAEEAARAALTPISAALQAALVEEKARKERTIGLESAARFATEALRRAEAALSDHPDPAAALATLETALAAADEHQRAAARTHARLAADAPDPSTAAARLRRTGEAIRQVEVHARDLETRIIALDAEIRHAAADAVDERLAETTDAREAAERSLLAVRHEIAVLKRLAAALQSAQAGARDRYLAPIRRELDPLIRAVLPEARVSIEADRMLPETLERAGRAEEIGILSGGTQEQIALLVRLAFARLLAREGRAAPVIFDDAIVFTDDDRIERMFDALTRQAEDLQIIVFSCRQRAFASLAGRQLRIEPAEAAMR